MLPSISKSTFKRMPTDDLIEITSNLASLDIYESNKSDKNENNESNQDDMISICDAFKNSCFIDLTSNVKNEECGRLFQYDLLKKRSDFDSNPFKKMAEDYRKYKPSRSLKRINVNPNPKTYSHVNEIRQLNQMDENNQIKKNERKKNDEYNQIAEEETNDDSDSEDEGESLQKNKNELKEFFEKFMFIVNKHMLGNSTSAVISVYKNSCPKLQKLVQILFKKVYKIRNMSEREMMKILRHKTTKKRNEEMIKLIYKQVIKKKYLRFLKNYLNEDVTQTPRQRKSKFYENFNRFLFRELIEKKIINEDLILDIVSEVTDVKKTKQFKLTRSNNWRVKGFANLKKVSTHYRYLIKMSQKLCDQMKKGIKKSKTDFVKIIKKKMKDKKNDWKGLLDYCINVEDFIFRFEQKINENGTKFKFPWSLPLTQRAIQQCLFDLAENEDLENNFLKLQDNHYSSFLE